MMGNDILGAEISLKMQDHISQVGADDLLETQVEQIPQIFSNINPAVNEAEADNDPVNNEDNDALYKYNFMDI